MATTEQKRGARAQQTQQRARQGPQLTSLSEAARGLLKGAPYVGQQTIGAGVRGEAHPVRSLLRKTMKRPAADRR
jgi:hypothetical protein